MPWRDRRGTTRRGQSLPISGRAVCRVDGSVFIERLVARPRHIEVQILADAWGNVVHLHERDCSMQLRHQKVVKVAPAPGLASDLREQMLTDAITLVKAASYVNAGIVEFLVSPETGEYFFVECNPHVNGNSLKSLLLPIPPRREQVRIAAKVDHLMSLCDKLEAKLKQSKTDSEQLMDVMVQNVLAA